MRRLTAAATGGEVALAQAGWSRVRASADDDGLPLVQHLRGQTNEIVMARTVDVNNQAQEQLKTPDDHLGRNIG